MNSISLHNDYYNVKKQDKEKFWTIPHGSGIDFRWYIEDKKKYFKCQNIFHVMNEVGFYIGFCDFSIIIPKKNPNKFRLHFHGNTSQYYNKKYSLRESLEGLFYHWINKAFNNEY